MAADPQRWPASAAGCAWGVHMLAHGGDGRYVGCCVACGAGPFDHPIGTLAVAVNVGFTGSRHGLEQSQRQRLVAWLGERAGTIESFHHGDCVGADARAHGVVVDLGLRDVVVQHPPQNERLRAHCIGGTTLPRKPYLERNRDIVDASDLLLAAPGEGSRGTLQAMAYARARGVPVVVL